jgi:hypothetical protein
MRATFLLLLSFITIGLFLWANLSGASFIMGVLIWLIILIITVGYPDTMVLFLLGAREVRSSDEKDFFSAASHEAYKLSVSMPRLYFYNGSLERAFVLQNRQSISIILNKSLLEKCTSSELKAICFELLLQVKKGMASKRTKSMFLLGFFAWMTHALIGLIFYFLPFRDLKKSADWVLNYLLHPVLDLMFKFVMGERYFKKLSGVLSNFPEEREMLYRVGMKLRKPDSYYSLPSRKLMELSAINKSRNFQNITALEFLPHEWDYLFVSEGLKRAE